MAKKKDKPVQVNKPKATPTIRTATTEQLAMELNKRYSAIMIAQNAINEINAELNKRQNNKENSSKEASR